MVETKSNEEQSSYTGIFPYWLKIPHGWDYPASCASGNAKTKGWAASVDLQRGKRVCERC
jgi:hypothetical protein